MFKKGKNIFSLLIIIASIFMTSSTNMVEAQETDSSPGVSAVTTDTDEDTGSTGDTEEPTSSKDWGNQFITKVQLQDANGNKQDSFGLYDDMRAYWEFSTNNNQITSGDTMTVQVPKNLTIQNSITTPQPVNEKPSGKTVATATLNKDSRTVTIKFNDYAANKSKTSSIVGSFYINTSWDLNLVTSNKEVPLDWGVSTSVTNDTDSTSSATATPPSTEGQDNGSVLYKYGSFDNNEILWNVEINYPGKKLSDVSYQDHIGNNQELVADSVKVNSASKDSSGSVTNDSDNKYKDVTATQTDYGFSVPLGDISTPINISYRTKITNPDNLSKSYSNSGDLLSQNTIIQNTTVNRATTTMGTGAHTADEVISPLGQKKWSVPEGTKLPDSIVVNLLRDNEKVASQTVNADNNWQYIFYNQPQYDDQGNLYHYTVSENPVDGFFATTDPTNYDITNHVAGTFKVTKLWQDGNNAENTRPTDIKVNLYNDDHKPISNDAQTLNAENDWKYTFENVPNNEDENWYASEIDSPSNYYKIQYANNGNPQDQTMVNVLKTSLKVQKEWTDDDSTSRPDSIQIQLYANDDNQGEQPIGEPVTLNNDNNWSYSFGTNANTDNKDDPTNQLPKYDENDKKITYSAKEVEVPNGYTSSFNFNDDKTVETITNTKDTTPPVENTKTLTVKKIWDDKDNQDKIRPDKVTVHLLINGKNSSDSVVLNADNKWTYTWKNLSPDDTYTVTEDKITDYTSSQTTDDNTNTITLTNTHVPDTKNPDPDPSTPDKPDNPDPENPTPETPDTPDPTPTDPNPETPSEEKDPDPDPKQPTTPDVPDTPNVDKNSDPIIPTDPFTPDDKTSTSNDFNPDPMVPNVPYSNDQLPQTGNKELNWLYPLIGVMILGLVTFRIKKRN